MNKFDPSNSHRVDKSFRNFQFLLFLFVGGTAFLIEWLIFFITRKLLFSQESYNILNFTLPGLAISAGIGYSISAIYNFSLNKFLTFNTENKYTLLEIIKFIIVLLFTIWIIQPLILYVLVKILNISEVVAILLKAIILLVTNFIAHKFFTFSNK